MASASSARTSTSLQHLPYETLDHILAFLDGPPPSKRNFVELPSPWCTNAKQRDLKHVSTVCHYIRSVAIPRLFRHARLDPYHLTDFLELVHRDNLNSSIETIIAILQKPYDQVHPAWWCRLLNEVRPARLAIWCPPGVLEQLTQVPLYLADSWAFNMNGQCLELTQSPETAIQDISYDLLPSLIGAKSWHSITVNEGSSLSAYTTFEYFLKKPPSLMSNLQAYLGAVAAAEIVGSQQETRELSLDRVPARSIREVLTELRSFSFVAIFPFYNHVDEVLKCIRRMSKLEKLFIKLCPEPDRTVLEDEIQAAAGHFDINDPWNEIMTAYTLVAHTVRFMTSQTCLATFTADDIKIEAIREAIINPLSEVLQGGWNHDGNGSWSKVTEPRTT